MLNNPFEKKSDLPDLEFDNVLDSKDKSEISSSSDLDDSFSSFSNQSASETLNNSFNEKYQFKKNEVRLAKRDVERELTDEEYHQRLVELNTDAENKHYVLFLDNLLRGKLGLLVVFSII